MSRHRKTADEEIAEAVRRHPAGSSDLARAGFGVRRIELRAAQELTVESLSSIDGRPVSLVGKVTVPPVHVLECLGCGALLAIGSPLITKHHIQHRRQAAARAAVRPLRQARGFGYRTVRAFARWFDDHVR